MKTEVELLVVRHSGDLAKGISVHKITGVEFREFWRHCVSDHSCDGFDLVFGIENIIVAERLEARGFAHGNSALLLRVVMPKASIGDAVASSRYRRRRFIRRHSCINVSEASIV